MTTANFNYEKHAYDVMEKLGLEGWVFRVNNRLSRALGRCVRGHKGKFIEIGGAYIRSASHEDIMDTIAHEIAHAAAWDFDGHWGHGKEWKKWCKVVGANPSPRKELPKEVDAAIREKDRFVLCVIHEDNGRQYKVEMIDQTSPRRTNLRGKQLIGRPSTRGLLAWYDKRTQRITTYY